MKPLVSVLMCVHNEKIEYLRLALDSIRNQSYKELEIIIVDDYSDTGCANYLQSIADKDKRITILHNDSNLGLTQSLNIALAHSTGLYIARMDADDYSKPNRIEKQVDFLENHDTIDIVGSGVVSFGDKVIFMSPAQFTDSDQIKAKLFFTSSLCHPAVMIRRAFLDKHDLRYDDDIEKGQDYELWERSSIYGNLAVMNDVLLYYRIHDKQISSVANNKQVETATMVRKRRLKRIGISLSDEDYILYTSLLGRRSDNIVRLKEIVNDIIRANRKTKIVDDKTLKSELQLRYAIACIKSGVVKIELLPYYIKYGISSIYIRARLMKYKRIAASLNKIAEVNNERIG